MSEQRRSDPARRGQWGQVMRLAISYPQTRIGSVLLVLLLGTALLGPLLAPYSPTEFVGAPFTGASGDAIFGTDSLGRDVFTRVLWGGRSVLLLATAATVLGVGGGALIGVIAGYARNWLDDALMRSMDVFLAFPQIVFVLLLISMVGPRLWMIVATVAITHMPRVARVARGSTLEIVEKDFIKASEAVAESRWRILLSEILPNISSPLLVEFGLRMTYSVGLIAAVSFLGFGLQPPTADWGLMINENRVGLTNQPWAVVAPVAAIGILTIGMNLVTDGIGKATIGIDRAKSA